MSGTPNACPDCASLAPRMRQGANEWIGNAMRRAIGARIARTRAGAVTVAIAAFAAGFAVEKAVKRICEGSQHVHARPTSRVAHWRRAIVPR